MAAAVSASSGVPTRSDASTFSAISSSDAASTDSMSTHWNGTIAHASSVASSAVQYGTFAPMRIDDAFVFVEGERRDGQRHAAAAQSS